MQNSSNIHQIGLKLVVDTHIKCATACSQQFCLRSSTPTMIIHVNQFN